MYCPTTCGVADYMLNYFINADGHLEKMLRDLESIANLTQDAEETVVYMKDSMAVAQKSFAPGNTADTNPGKTSTHPVSGINVILCCILFAQM